MTERCAPDPLDLLRCPTAPGCENAPAAFIADFCRTLALVVASDSFGNLHVTPGPAYPETPIVFVAHMDHPGFVADGTDGNAVSARFLGSVESDYLVPGTGVEFWTPRGPVPARILPVGVSREARALRCRLHAEAPVPAGTPGMWSLPARSLKHGRIYSRACDDLCGCAALLGAARALATNRGPHPTHAFLFTCREEVGLEGAHHAVRDARLPRDATIVSIECSSVLPGVRMGGGVIVRVGDRQSIFTPHVTAFLLQVAAAIQPPPPHTFRFQRKLMDGGTCEGTAFAAAGFATGALALPLGNYHNRDVRRRRIAPEYVARSDYDALIALVVEAARSHSPVR